MSCPRCGVEHADDTGECPSDDTATTRTAPPDWVDFVTVMTTRDLSELAVAKSVLESAGIPFFARNEGVENLLSVGPVELQVRPELAGEAATLLRELDEPEDEEETEESSG
jgi:putative signal transducing protein